MTFEEACTAIDIKHQELNLPYGWRFLYVPRRNLVENNGLVIVGLNPGGYSLDMTPDVTEGNAYIDEQWRSPIQKKMNKLIADVCGENLWYDAAVDLLYHSVTSNFIPFISPQINDLFGDYLVETVEFSTWLWSNLLKDIKPKVILAIGHTAGKFMMDSIDVEWTGLLKNVKTVRENRQAVHLIEYDRATLISIPHLAHWAAHCDKPSLIKAVAIGMASLDISPGIRCAT